MAPKCIAIVGAGHAGVQAAASLREEGFNGRIELIGAEHHLPYHRPPLSKRFSDDLDENVIALRPASFYESRQISLSRGTAVESIDTSNQRLRVSTGRTIAYDHLVLATGASNRRLGVDGESLAGVVSVRQMSDARKLAGAAAGAKHAVVVGAGFLGVETAASLFKLGLCVHIAASRPLPLGRSVTLNTAFKVAATLEEKGIKISNEAAVACFEGVKGRVRRVHYSDGSSEEADVVVVGIGADPNTDLARAAGLEVSGGILVDADLQTSTSNVSAIGDCVQVRNSSGRVRRLESVHNANIQARRLAARLTGGNAPRPETPWFWSDIGELQLRMVGLSMSEDTILSSRTQDGGWAMLCFRDGILVAAETINANKTHIAARKMLDSQVALSIEEAGRPGFDIAACAAPKRAFSRSV